MPQKKTSKAFMNTTNEELTQLAYSESGTTNLSTGVFLFKGQFCYSMANRPASKISCKND